MPKPIKKKLLKAESQQEDVQEMLSNLAAQAAERKRQLAIAGIAALVLLLVAAGAYLFNKNASQRALFLESEGYMLYSGSYETGTERSEALERALKSFRDANATRPTAFRKYYIAEVLYELGRYEESLKALDEFDSEHSSNMRFVPISRLKRAMAHRSMGDNEAALSTLQEFNFITSKSLKDYAMIQTAELLEDMGREGDAQQYYSQLLMEYPESRFAQLAQSRVKQPEKAGGMPGPGGIDLDGGQKPLSIELK
jgi:tetratricopeptide (TPR) repeat protein